MSEAVLAAPGGREGRALTPHTRSGSLAPRCAGASPRGCSRRAGHTLLPAGSQLCQHSQKKQPSANKCFPPGGKREQSGDCLKHHGCGTSPSSALHLQHSACGCHPHPALGMSEWTVKNLGAAKQGVLTLSSAHQGQGGCTQGNPSPSLHRRLVCL